MAKGDNFGLITVRQQSTFDFQHIIVANTIIESGAISLQTQEWGYIFPLYLNNSTTDLLTTKCRNPNLSQQIVSQIAEKSGLKFTSEKDDSVSSTSGNPGTFAPIDLLDYIYAVLHSPTYREKYKEFLKIDFPRVPYPKDAATFWQLVALGSELRQIHLLESPVVKNYITQYPVGGSNMVEKVRFENSNVFINDTQYFANVPQAAWGFYIGGYQPAQKWLKDRKDRELQFEDIQHYQKIIVALSETDRLMKEIDKIPDF
jgi:predicted helicase